MPLYKDNLPAVIILSVSLLLYYGPSTSLSLMPSTYATASWYSCESAAHIRTASGEIFDDQRMTCASNHFPIDSQLRITNLDNGHQVIVRVNDRGPAWYLGREVDLTKEAFKKMAPLSKGLIRVRISVLHRAKT